MLNNWIFHYKKKRQGRREVVMPNYSKVRSVVIVYEQGVADKETALLAKRLERDGMMVEVVGYEPKKDFNHFGLVRDAAKTALPSQRFDVLIDMSTHYYIGTQYIVMALDATFKTGMRFAEVNEKDQEGVLDMMVSLKEEEVHPEDVAEQVIYYLKMINKS